MQLSTSSVFCSVHASNHHFHDCVRAYQNGTAVQEEEALQLVDSMLENDALSQLVYRLRHFNESVPEEAEAVQKLLSVFENLIEVKPIVAEQLVQLGDNKTGFLRHVAATNSRKFVNVATLQCSIVDGTAAASRCYNLMIPFLCCVLHNSSVT